jgi:hypothetical protein
MSRAQLLGWGATRNQLTIAVRAGELVRLRRDHYCLPELGAHAQRAVRVGGRLGCVSALQTYGIFAYDTAKTHIHLERDASRLRAPTARLEPLSNANRFGHRLHWDAPIAATEGDETRVGLRDALVQAVRCQHPWHGIASLDNALHQGLIGESELDEIFAVLSSDRRDLRRQLDARSEAGQESVLRLIVQERHLPVIVQPTFPGIGRADLLVAGCVILEADSRAHHSGWEEHVEDRHRDLKFAKLGYPTLRPAYQHTMHFPQLVGDAVVQLVHQQRRFSV